MRSLLAALALVPALALTGCFSEPDTYDVKVDWVTANPPPGIATARVWYEGDWFDTKGYTGTARVTGEAFQPEIEICVQLGHIEIVEDDSTYCDIAGCTPSPELVPDTDKQCARIPFDQKTVAFSF